MATGYNIILPNGSTYHTSTSSLQERLAVCNQLIQAWQEYCYKNWMSGGDSPWSPENKVKNFLSSLGFFLMIDNSEGVITRYKNAMNSKREIPVSSCPTYVGDYVYGLHHSCSPDSKFAKGEDESFNVMMEEIDGKVAKTFGKVIRKKKPSPNYNKETRYDRVCQARASGLVKFDRCVVNTDGEFEHQGTHWIINMESCPAYAGHGPDGDEYAMTYVIVGQDKDGARHFYDEQFHWIDFAVAMH